MEWRKQCFEAGPNEQKNDESEKEKEKYDDPTDKEKFPQKEIVPPGLKDPKMNKEIPSGFDPKETMDPSSKGKNPKDGKTLSSRDLEQTQKKSGESQELIDPIKLTPLSLRGP